SLNPLQHTFYFALSSATRCSPCARQHLTNHKIGNIATFYIHCFVNSDPYIVVAYITMQKMLIASSFYFMIIYGDITASTLVRELQGYIKAFSITYDSYSLEEKLKIEDQIHRGSPTSQRQL
ncbi:hypothetical protein L9F63_028036, partial [Diploptera punctata]